jgi:hypothetical protein
MPEYEVLLHGSNLALLDEEGAHRVGGVYAWRFVAANNEAAAISKAKEDLLSDPTFLEELWGPADESITLEIDEIRERPEGSPAKEASPVFYIDEPE